jgi:hypothetical protein
MSLIIEELLKQFGGDPEYKKKLAIRVGEGDAIRLIASETYFSKLTLEQKRKMRI